MLEPHYLFSWPADDTVLWRYIDLARLVNLLETQSLWLSRADLLGDDHEGSLAYGNAPFGERAYAGLPDTFFEQRSFLGHSRPKVAFVNCWHVAEGESMAMWKIYSGRGLGVAIETSFRRLRESIITEESILAGLVQYIDYEDAVIPESNLLAPFTYKRAAYGFEREFRILTARFDSLRSPGDLLGVPAGVRCTVNPERLIERVIVGPEQSPWEVDVVLSTVRKFGYEVPCSQSSLGRKPML